jgi:hypothetical protein
MRAQAVLLMVVLLHTTARADDARLRVVVREGARDGTIVERLRGQLADLDDIVLDVEPASAAIEATLDAQLAAADQLGTAHDARVVVWFVPRGRTLAVAIATPRDHRLFVREIPTGAESAVAEAAAIVVRGAVRSIALGGTIGVEVKREEAPVEPIEGHATTTTSTATTLDAALGWQVAIDGGAERGAQALVQRTTLARGPWAASLAITLGVPLEWRAGSDVALDVARSGAAIGGERRLGGGLALGITAGAVVYHRSTRAAPTGLAPTPSNSTFAFASGVEVAWRAHVAGPLGLVACAGVDVVLGAPEAAIARDTMVDVVDTIHAVQPRASLSLEVGAW